MRSKHIHIIRRGYSSRQKTIMSHFRTVSCWEIHRKLWCFFHQYKKILEEVRKSTAAEIVYEIKGKTLETEKKGPHSTLVAKYRGLYTILKMKPPLKHVTKVHFNYIDWEYILMKSGNLFHGYCLQFIDLAEVDVPSKSLCSILWWYSVTTDSMKRTFKKNCSWDLESQDPEHETKYVGEKCSSKYNTIFTVKYK